MEFILASNNQKKLAEMQRILSPLGIEVKTAAMLELELPDVVEDGDTFEANAALKARHAARSLLVIFVSPILPPGYAARALCG